MTGLSLKAGDVRCEDYWSAKDEILSDHKPVLAQLVWSVDAIDPIALDRAFQVVLKEMDAIQNDAIPATELATNVVDCGEVVWRRLVERTVRLFNRSRTLIQFSVSNVPHWLRVSPGHGFVGPGGECELYLYVMVSSQGPVDEVIVIHIENGYDHFVNVFGRLRRTDFGMPLRTLCQPSGESLMEEGGNHHHAVVPRILLRLINYLIRRDSLSAEIFTASPDRSLLAVMQDALDLDKDFDRELPLNSSESAVLTTTAHTIIRFFDSLPEPLLPNDVLSSTKEAAQAILDLDESICCTFLYFTDFLRRHIVRKDKSAAEALCILFAGILFRSDMPEMDSKEEARMLKRRVAFLMHFIA